MASDGRMIRSLSTRSVAVIVNYLNLVWLPLHIALHCNPELRHVRVLGLVLAAALVFLPDRLHSLPAAPCVRTLHGQIVHESTGDQVLLQFTGVDGFLTEGACGSHERPVLNANVAEGVTE